MSLISIKNLSFAYPGTYDNIFTNVNLTIDTNYRLGFVGRNGRGKTTLLRLLMNKYEYEGTISKDVDFTYFPYTNYDSTGKTLELLQKISGASDWEIIRELGLLSITADLTDRDFSTLSMGERTKALLAALFLRKDSYILIDEPTNHLDYDSRIILANYLSAKHGFILVSHDRALLDACVTHILSINKSSIELQRGNFTSWEENKRRNNEYELKRNKTLTNDITRLSTATARTADWSYRVERTKSDDNSGVSADTGYAGAKSAKLMRRAKAIQKRTESMIADKESLLTDVERNETLKIFPKPYYSDRLIELHDFSIYYGEKCITSGVDLCIRNGDRLLLRGQNGSGKSSILKIIANAEKIAHTGSIFVPQNLSISYVSQTTFDLCGTLTEYGNGYDIDMTLFLTILRKFGFERTQFEKNISSFSEGQKKKVLLARSLSESANIYIWDEPHNYIDVISRIQIEELLLTYKPTILFVEHDIAFCDNICTDVVDLKAN